MNGDLRRLVFVNGLTDTTNSTTNPSKQRLIESFSNGGETAGAVERRHVAGVEMLKTIE